jgi:hypothetical protein
MHEATGQQFNEINNAKFNKKFALISSIPVFALFVGSKAISINAEQILKIIAGKKDNNFEIFLSEMVKHTGGIKNFMEIGSASYLLALFTLICFYNKSSEKEKSICQREEFKRGLLQLKEYYSNLENSNGFSKIYK